MSNAVTQSAIHHEREQDLPLHWIVYTASASMPGSCRAPYHYAAVILVPVDCTRPLAINARSVFEVAYRSSPYPARGKTPRSARVQVLEHAQELCERLNRELEQARRESAIRVGATVCAVTGEVHHV